MTWIAVTRRNWRTGMSLFLATGLVLAEIGVFQEVGASPAPNVEPQRIASGGNRRYKPPRRGIPQRREGAGTRSGSSRTTCLRGSQALLPLVPEDGFGLTTRDRPTLAFYLPETTLASNTAELMLVNNQDGILYETTLQLPKTRGIVSITLPDDAPSLKVNQEYRWSVSLRCELEAYRNPWVEGTIQRVVVDQSLAAQLQRASDRDRPAVYAQAGIWYDALSSLVELRRARPTSDGLVADWQELLGSVRLGTVAKEPLAFCPSTSCQFIADAPDVRGGSSRTSRANSPSSRNSTPRRTTNPPQNSNPSRRRPPVYRPPVVPPFVGNQVGTKSAGRRGGCLREGTKEMQAVTPLVGFGQTTRDRPSFLVYIPELSPSNRRLNGEFLLSDALNQDRIIYKTRVPIPQSSGVISLTLPENAPGLIPGKSYHWSFTLICSSSPSGNPSVESYIQRVKPNANLTNSIRQMGERDRPSIYAGGSIWYDALASLANLRRIRPSDPALADDWQQFLVSAGLTSLTNESLVAFCPSRECPLVIPPRATTVKPR